MTVPAREISFRVEVDYPERLSRRLVFLKAFVIYPDMFYVLRVSLGAIFLSRRASGKEGMPLADALALVGVARVVARWMAYAQYGLTDLKPPRTTEHVQEYPVRLWIDTPDLPQGNDVRLRLSRTLGGGLAALKWYPRFLATAVAALLARPAVLVTGRYPRALFNFNVRSLQLMFGRTWVVLPLE